MGSTPIGKIRFRQRSNIHPGDLDGAVVRLIDTGDQVEEGALSRTGRPHEREKFTPINTEINILKDM